MCKKNRLLILLTMIVFILYGMPINLQGKEEAYTLVVYDKYKEFAKEENLLNKLLLVVLQGNNNLIIREEKEVLKEEIIKAERVIYIREKEEENPIEELKKIREDIVFLSLKEIKDGDFHKIKELLEIKEEPKCYLVLSKVYPYSNIGNIALMGEYLQEKNIPYLVEAMPIYDNLEYEAMKSYEGLLRYLAYKEGSIFISFPKVEGQISGKEVIEEKLVIFNNELIKEGIYPLGFICENEELYNKIYREILQSSNTVVLQRKFNIQFKNYNDEIKGIKNLIVEGELLGKGCVVMDSSLSIEEFKSSINTLQDLGYSFSYIEDDLDMKLSLGDFRVEGMKRKGIYLNGKKINKEINISHKEEEKETNTKIDLGGFNKFIYCVTGLGILLFIFFYFNSLGLDKKKYFREDRK